MSICLVQSVECLKFKNIGYSKKGGVSNSSPNKNNLLSCNMVISYEKVYIKMIHI